MIIYYDDKGYIAPDGIEIGTSLEVDSLPDYDEDKFEYLMVEDGEVVVKECSEALVSSKIKEYKEYLTSTDWYYARYAETGEAVPEDIVIARTEAREYIRRGEDTISMHGQ